LLHRITQILLLLFWVISNYLIFPSDFSFDILVIYWYIGYISLHCGLTSTCL
jgi:hypothetical protein